MKDSRRKPGATALTPGARFSAPKRATPDNSHLGIKRASAPDSSLDLGVSASAHDAASGAALRNGTPRHRLEHRTRATPWRPRSVTGRRARRTISAILGVALVGGGAYAATSWIVGLNSGSSGEGQAASIQNLTITAVSSPAPTNQLFPGGTGDVVLTISNPNPYPVTVTSVNLPTNTTYAGGYTTSALTTTQTGCLTSTPSGVIWNFSTTTSGSAHTLTTALTVGPNGNANNPLTVTLTNDASMTATAPAACAAAFFSMPSLTGVVATGGAATVTSTPVVDAWTS